MQSTTAQTKAQQNRDTIFVEDGEILTTDAFAAEQFIQRIASPKCVAHAEAGSFVHITCDPSRPMRRPLSIMRVGDGWIEILYKVVGDGLRRLSEKQPGDRVSVLGPIGRPFSPDSERPHALLIGGGVGIPPMVFLADEMRKDGQSMPLAILGSEIPFPFALVDSKLEFAGVDDSISATMPLLESWAVPARLTSLAGFRGCFDGYVTDLAREWLTQADKATVARTKIFACGPTTMLRAAAKLASDYDVACEVSLEEFMACAVGGCAGCTLLVNTPDGQAMKRVCVDGPVFDASTIVWQ